MKSEMFVGLTLEEARRRAGDIMEQGKNLGGYSLHSTAGLQEIIKLVSAGLVTDVEKIILNSIDMEKPKDQPPATANSPKIHTPQKEPKTDKKVVLSPEAKRDLKEIEERFNYIMSKNRDINANQTAFMCKVCGKKDSDSAIIRNHIENDHAQEFNIPCCICQKRFRPGKTLRKHKEIVHLPFWKMAI